MSKQKTGDCWLKDKVLNGNEPTRDDSNGYKCTTYYKPSGRFVYFKIRYPYRVFLYKYLGQFKHVYPFLSLKAHLTHQSRATVFADMQMEDVCCHFAGKKTYLLQGPVRKCVLPTALVQDTTPVLDPPISLSIAILFHHLDHVQQHFNFMSIQWPQKLVIWLLNQWSDTPVYVTQKIQVRNLSFF